MNKVILLTLTFLITTPLIAMEEVDPRTQKRIKLEEGVVSHDKPEMITVKFSDDDMGIDINRLILEQSKTIKDLLEDIETNELFLGGTPITREMFNVVLPLMEQLNANQLDVIKKDVDSKNITELSNLWDIFNYLDVSDLLGLVSTDLSHKLFAQVKENPEVIPELLQGILDQFKRVKLPFSQLEFFLPDEIKKKLINRSKTLTDHAGTVRSSAFNPQGTLLATGSWDGTVIIYDISNPKEVSKITTLTDHTGSVWSVAFNPQGTLLATGSGNTVIIYDISNPKKVGKIATLNDHADTIWSVAFNPQGTLLATISGNTVNIYDISNPKKVGKIATLTDHADTVSSVEFNPQGTLLATGSLDGTVIIYDISNPKEVGKIATLTDHTGSVRSVEFNPQGTLLATGSWDKTVIIYDISNPKEVGKIATLTDHAGSVSSVEFNPQGTLLATGSLLDGTVIIYDISNPKEVGKITTLTDHTGWVSFSDFNPQGTLLATVSGNIVNIYDISLLNMFTNLTVGQALAVIYIVQIKPTRMSDIPKDIEQQFDLLDEPVKQVIYDYIEKES